MCYIYAFGERGEYAHSINSQKRVHSSAYCMRTTAWSRRVSSIYDLTCAFRIYFVVIIGAIRWYSQAIITMILLFPEKIIIWIIRYFHLKLTIAIKPKLSHEIRRYWLNASVLTIKVLYWFNFRAASVCFVLYTLGWNMRGVLLNRIKIL